MMDTAFSRFWLIVGRSHVGAERRHFLAQLFILHLFSTCREKFQNQVTQAQVTRSRQVTSPQKKIECLS